MLCLDQIFLPQHRNINTSSSPQIMRYTRHVHESKEAATRGHTKYSRIERVTSRSPDRDAAHQGPVPSLSLSLSLSLIRISLPRLDGCRVESGPMRWPAVFGIRTRVGPVCSPCFDEWLAWLLCLAWEYDPSILDGVRARGGTDLWSTEPRISAMRNFRLKRRPPLLSLLLHNRTTPEQFTTRWGKGGTDHGLIARSSCCASIVIRRRCWWSIDKWLPRFERGVSIAILE